MKMLLTVFVLLALTACATPKQAAPEDVAVSDRVKTVCDAEGGCTLFTREAFEAKLREAFAAGAATEAKRRGAL